jgi:hypothetical protein
MFAACHFPRRRLRALAGLTMLALCLQLVAVGMGAAHAAARLAGAYGTLEICAAGGMLRVPADVPDDGVLPASQDVRPHCPFCLASSHPPPLVAWTPSFVLPPALPRATLVVPDAGPRPLAPDRRHARNRAPPVRSA